jgi:mannosyl-oligosaccharide alpha-1,2-mannosidase
MGRRPTRLVFISFILVCSFFYFSSDELPATLPKSMHLPSYPYSYSYGNVYNTQVDRTSTNIPLLQHNFTAKVESAEALAIRHTRRETVRNAFIRSWRAYEENAWGHDELTPLSGSFRDPFMGWSATLVDSLDTLWIMGMKKDFEKAVNHVKTIDFTRPNSGAVPVFEITIRYLGGLLGAYDISGGKYPVLLQKATELADFLFRAFNTTSGMPVTSFNWESRKPYQRAGSYVLVAEIGSLSLEFTRLAQLTGDRKYFDAIQKVADNFHNAQNSTRIPGLWPSSIDAEQLIFQGNHFTLGAWEDSLYEYLPKVRNVGPEIRD